MCNECGKDFVDDVKLGLHQYNVHTVQCGKILQTKDRLIQHEKSHRLNAEELQTYSCDICKYKTNSKAYFNDHNKRMHKAQPGLWMCMSGTYKENPKSFINHQQMTKHQKIHENVSCPECNKSFVARRNMKRHMKNVHKARNEMKELKWITHGRKFE